MDNATFENTAPKTEELNDGGLSAITAEYPYYSVAQFRLLCNYKKNQHQNFEEQALTTALFFTNTKWLNRQLNCQTKIEDKGDQISEIPDSDKIISAPPEVEIEEIILPQIHDEKLSASDNANDAFNAFEPLHTVDYFASQGIKVSEEPINNDKLSNQLKSFTEWLKSMKKIHPHQLTESDEQTDKIIQHIAEGSNTNTHVVTEAMAEVLVKQDKLEQAIEMYEKLSLNYPAKSAYFAARIESLKSV